MEAKQRNKFSFFINLALKNEAKTGASICRGKWLLSFFKKDTLVDQR